MHQFLKFIFGIKFYMFRTVRLSIIRSFSLYTRQWYMSYRYTDSQRANVYDIFHWCVYSEKLLLMGSGNVRNMQNFIPKINLTKLVHLVGFIVTARVNFNFIRKLVLSDKSLMTVRQSQNIRRNKTGVSLKWVSFYNQWGYEPSISTKAENLFNSSARITRSYTRHITKVTFQRV